MEGDVFFFFSFFMISKTFTRHEYKRGKPTFGIVTTPRTGGWRYSDVFSRLPRKVGVPTEGR